MLKRWKVASSIAAGIAALSVIAVVLFYSIPVNPCTLFPFQSADANLVHKTGKELYDSSELVVVGRITDSTSKCEGSQIWTHMQIEVEDSAKNPESIKVLTGKTIGGRIGNYGYWVEDSPIFNKGDRAFLYLYKDKPDDTVYRISQYSGALAVNDSPDENISAKEILRTFRLQSVTTSNSSTLEIPQGSSLETTLTIESFFGYDSPTNVTVTSFTYYNDTVNDEIGTLTSEYANLSALPGYGVSVEPAYAVIQPVVNGITQTQLTITASDEAVPGVYDIIFSATPEDPYSYLAGGIGQTLLRINVTGDAGNIQQTTTQVPGISLVIEKYGEREFYQDRKVFLPTMLAVTKDDSVDWETLAWPSIGPNYVITRMATPESEDDGTVIFDYYKSLGIDENLTGIVYDEFMNKRDLSPPPATSGRYFGFEWNRTALDGTSASAGKYKVVLTMPVLIDDKATGSSRMLLESEPDYFTILDGKPAYLEHDFSLVLNVSKTELQTGETFEHSLFLTNNGNSTEYFSIDSGGVDFMSKEALMAANNSDEQEPCYFPAANGIKKEDWGLMSMYANYFLGGKSIDPGSSLAIADNVPISAPKYPGAYYLAGEITLTAADEEVEGKAEFDSVKVSCVDVPISNPIKLNVTAPIYEGVSLVLETDKQVYKRNETVILSLYIENDSSKPFRLSEVMPTIHIKDASGVEVCGFSWVADYSEYPTIAPHSRYNLNTGTLLTWGQTTHLEDGSTKPAEPGEYSMLATFTFPYLESKVHTISIE